MSQLPGLDVKGNSIYVNLYIAGNADINLGGKKVKLTQETSYPWSGDIQITTGTSGSYALKLRIPCWAQNRPVPSTLYTYADGLEAGWDVAVNGVSVNCAVEDGYCTIDRKWKKGDKVTVTLDMKPRTVVADSRVKDLEGMVAVECGPIVYCAESVDNEGRDIFMEPLDACSAFTTGSAEIDGAEVGTINADGRINFIPYYAWNHRGEPDMTVWLRRCTE